MKINWRVRVRNKAFWVFITPAVLVLAHNVLQLFGIDIDPTVLSDQLVGIIESVFVVLGALGIVVDPTTAGIGDSTRALTYDEPYGEYRDD